MVKYFCDRCGKEADRLNGVMVLADVYSICNECADELKKWFIYFNKELENDRQLDKRRRETARK